MKTIVQGVGVVEAEVGVGTTVISGLGLGEAACVVALATEVAGIVGIAVGARVAVLVLVACIGVAGIVGVEVGTRVAVLVSSIGVGVTVAQGGRVKVSRRPVRPFTWVLHETCV